MELYYTIAVLDRDKSREMGSLFQEAGLPTSMTLFGRGTATREHLILSGVEARDKAILCAVSDAAQAKQLFKLARRRMQIDIPGNGIIMNIPLKSVAGGRTLAFLTDSAVKEGRPNMNFQHELIIVIMNEGYSDFVMEAAIMRAISEKAGPGTKAGAICFSLPISSVIGLRARESE